MKKIISLALALIMVLCSVAIFASCDQSDDLSAAYNKALKKINYDGSKYKDTLVVAMSPDFAPMEFYDTAKNEIVGFDVLLATYIAKELGMKLVLDPMSFDASMAAVSSGNADLAISGFSWTAERAETFLISDYYVAGENETEQILITTAAKKDQFTADKDNFTGLKIGAQGGSLQELLVKEQLVTKGAEIELYININDAATALATGEIDALAVAYGNGEALANDTIVLSDFYFDVEAIALRSSTSSRIMPSSRVWTMARATRQSISLPRRICVRESLVSSMQAWAISLRETRLLRK